MHFVYVLSNARERYIGFTANLIQRLKEHRRTHPGYKLVYYEAYTSEKLARTREKRLKYFGSAWRGLIKRLRA